MMVSSDKDLEIAKLKRRVKTIEKELEITERRLEEKLERFARRHANLEVLGVDEERLKFQGAFMAKGNIPKGTIEAIEENFDDYNIVFDTDVDAYSNEDIDGTLLIEVKDDEEDDEDYPLDPDNSPDNPGRVVGKEISEEKQEDMRISEVKVDG